MVSAMPTGSFRIALAMAVLPALLPCAAAPAASLYQPDTYQALAADRKARRSGDLITVLVYENASASSIANTSTGRDASVGGELALPSQSRHAGLGANNQLDGHGRTQREGRVLAQITVRVVQVLDNGDLRIAGEQLLEVNNERQQIKVEGRVRPQDISEANTVLSTRLADARISYAGEGDLSERQRPAWWHKVLTWFGF
jgi:flagellar L-ring protein precursor FlgH